MVILATSRKNRRRVPLADMLMFSFTLAPLKTRVLVPAWALDGVASIARVPDEGVIAVAQQDDIVAPAAAYRVIARAPNDNIVSVATDDRVIAVAAIVYDLNAQCNEAIPAGDHIVSSQSVDVERERAGDIHRDGVARDDCSGVAGHG